MKIVLAGDYCPQDRVAMAFNKGDYSCLDAMRMIITQADYSIVNLECPITESSMLPITKSGPNLCASQEAIDALSQIGVCAVSLANNHFRDYGDEGIEHTLSILQKYQMDYVGGGKSINEANQVLYKLIDGKKVAIIACCESESSIGTASYGGSNPINPIQQYYAIQTAKNHADYVIVIAHGGIEHYSYPTPRMQELFRFYIDAGADAVINHHQHCYSGYEEYHNRPIFYGLGNFCFDNPHKRHDKYNEGYVVELDLGDCVSYRIIPYVQCDDVPIVRMMDSKEQIRFEQRMKKINALIADANMLQSEYDACCARVSQQYHYYVEPYQSRWTRFLYKHHLLPTFLTNKKKMVLANVIRCESHRDRLLNVLKQ